MSRNLLQVENLQVTFGMEKGMAIGVDEVSFSVQAGSNLAIVGESGCGKSVTSLSCMHLLGRNGQITKGKIVFDGEDITHISEKAMENIRGAQISMVFQEPMTSLNPVLSIGFQLSETLRIHTKKSPREIQERLIELLDQVGIPNGEKALKSYPHELSGGMRQRVMIAMALACSPKLLIADEPTTALDVTIQAQILNLLKKLQKETGITIMIITHDLGIVAEMADEVVVMYAGLVVEKANVVEIFDHPMHPYTEGLLKSIIHVDASMGSLLHFIPGIVPSVYDRKPGCPFYDRCSYAGEKCKEVPKLVETKSKHFVRCFMAGGTRI